MSEPYKILPDPPLDRYFVGDKVGFLLIATRKGLRDPRDCVDGWILGTAGGRRRVQAVRGPNIVELDCQDEGRHQIVCRYHHGNSTRSAEYRFEVERRTSTGRLLDALRIVMEPRVSTVVPGQKVDFRLEQTQPYAGLESLAQLSPRWFCLNDLDAKPDAVPVIKGAEGIEWKGEDWDFTGRHRIVCAVTWRGEEFHLELPVSVVQLDTIAQTAPLASVQPSDPIVALNAIRNEIKVIRKIAEHHPPPADKAEVYAQRMAMKQDYINRLEGLLATSQDETRIPISATYFSRHNPKIESTKTQWMPLNVFLSKATNGRWRLVDWTNPLEKHCCGDYDGWGLDRYHSPGEAIAAWNSHNRYPEGLINLRYFVGSDGPAAPSTPEMIHNDIPVSYAEVFKVRHEFETDGESTADSVAKIFDYIALGGAAVAGVVFLVAPVPGSRIVSAAIWTSIFASTAAATINIAQRHEQGFGGWREDMFDALTIASNIFAAGAAGQIWKRGATLTIQGAAKVQRVVIVGQFSTDGVQGVMIAADHWQAFEAIQKDPSLAPDERLHKIVALVGRLSLDGLLTYINLKGTKADLDHLNAQNKHLPPEMTPKERLDKLADPELELDLTTKRPVEGETSQGKHTTTAQTAHPKLRPKLSPEELKLKLAEAERRALGARLNPDTGNGYKKYRPALATVVDKRTGDTFHGYNKTDYDRDLHPLLEKRREAYVKQLNERYKADPELIKRHSFGEDDKAIYGIPGEHAEVKALNDALWARQDAIDAAGKAGATTDLPPMTDDVLDEFLLSVRRTQKVYPKDGVPAADYGAIMPRCPHCNGIITGIDMVDEMRASERLARSEGYYD